MALKRLKLVQAAIKVNGVVHTGNRHHEILKQAPTFGDYKYGIQGFVDENGNFWNRHQAARIAYVAGQMNVIKDNLTSEDLW